MKNWQIVHDSQEKIPDVFDIDSSETTVYERRNIHKVPVYTMLGNIDIPNATQWEYEQREYTREEYNSMNSLVIKTIMQTLSGLELSIAEMSTGKAV